MTIQAAQDMLKTMRDNYYFIDGVEETIKDFYINTQKEIVTITTDKKTRTTNLSELGTHLKIYSKKRNEIEVKPSGIAMLEKLPENSNLSYIEEALITSIKKLQDGNIDHIPVAESTNRLATTILNIQKSKIEMGKLIIEAHKAQKE